VPQYTLAASSFLAGRSSAHSLLIMYRCTLNFGFDARRVYIGNLSFGMDHLDLKDVCSEFGAVEVGPQHT